MTPGDGKTRFVDFVKIEAMDNRFIGRDDEKRLLQEGMTRFGLSLDEARGAMLSTAGESGIVLQRGTEDEIREILSVSAAKSNRNAVTKAQFDQAVDVYRAKVRGRMTDDEIRKRVKTIMQQNDMTARRSGWILPSRRWFNAIRN